MRTPPFLHKVHYSTGSDTLDTRPRNNNDTYTHRTIKGLDLNHSKPIIVHRTALLSKFSPIFGKTGSKGASRLNIELPHIPSRTIEEAPDPSPTTSCFTNELDPFRRTSPVLLTPPDEQPRSPIFSSPPQASEPMKRREFVPEMQDIIQGATRISSTNPIRAFHLPTRWVPRTARMDTAAFSRPSKENPLKIVLGSGLSVTLRSRSTTALPITTEIRHKAYGITTPSCSPERLSIETGDRSLAYPDCPEFNHSTTHENSFNGMFENET